MAFVNAIFADLLLLYKIDTYSLYAFTVDYTNDLLYNIITGTNKAFVLNQAAGARKENDMEEMTNEQFRTILEMIIQLIKDSESKEDAVKKIEALVSKD